MAKKAAKKDLVPGNRVRTPWGLAWVNVAPPDVKMPPSEIFIRLSDDSTRRVEAAGLQLVDF